MYFLFPGGSAESGLTLHKMFIGSALFHALLARFDAHLAAEVRARGCPRCGGPLDVGDYERKPRGGPKDLPPQCLIRRSLCCRIDGCRTREKPPSIQYLDRRVYLGTVVVLFSALAEGATPQRMKRLRARIGASEPTIRRWRQWWRDTFPRLPVGQLVRARVGALVDAARLPRSLLEWLDESLAGGVLHVLRLVAGVHAL